MKRFLFLITLAFVSCKKETNSPNVNNNSNTNSNNQSSALVNSIDCSSINISGNLKKGQDASSVSVIINYFGGNGKAYNSQNISSTGVSGLIAKLEAGVLAVGNSSLKFLISGSPSSAGIASFPITIGGKSCEFAINIDDISETTGINFTPIGTPIGKFGNGVIDIEGNKYRTVVVANQEWMAENLRVTKYNDGTKIPIAEEVEKWKFDYYNTVLFKDSFPLMTWYNNNKQVYFELFGGLYNYYVINPRNNSGKNVCPSGWHVPKKSEVTILIDNLGGEAVAANKLKEIGVKNWKYDSKSTNSSLLTILPSGKIQTMNYGISYFTGISEYGNFWTQSEYIISNYYSYGYAYNISSNHSNIVVGYNDKVDGLSIRCLKD
jgi:uncharacterized protein (TIGR02145 family)